MNKEISENRWLPPSPHREEILKIIEAGRAYIEEYGHHIPPLLVFEDGGAIELSKVRYRMTGRGMQLVAGGDSSSSDQTKHPDVCGTIDELKELLKDQPELAKSAPDLLDHLLGDACYMISRMQRRREAYKRFVTDIAALCKRMEAVGGPNSEEAYKKADEMRAFLRNSPEDVTDKLEELYKLAEGVRRVAGDLENSLSACRDVAIEVGRLYREIKGGRTWQEDESAARKEQKAP